MSTSKEASHSWIDQLGTGCGIACTIHCLLSAFAPGLILITGGAILLSHEIEWILTSLSIMTAIWGASKNVSTRKSYPLFVLFSLSAIGLVQCQTA